MLQKVLVRPSIPIVPGVEQISPLDQYMVRVILPMMCIFHVESPELRPAIVANLKAGLASTIDEIRFLAADILPESEERDSIQLEYEEGAGVWFYSQELPDFNFQTLARRNFPFSGLPVNQFVARPWGHSNKCPVLTILVTFITGGAVVTFNGHHAVMDAQGLGTFAQTWAKHVAAESEGRAVSQDEKLSQEILDGISTFSSTSSRSLAEFPTYWIAKQRPYESSQSEILKAAVSGDFDRLGTMIRLSHWSLPQQALDCLMSTVHRNSSTPVVTENALISALIWRHVSRARQLSSREVGTSALLTSVNVRRRMDPPLPLEYLGNAIVLARATATAADLESDGSLYDLALKVMDSVDWWTADQIWDLCGSIDACTNVGNRIIPPVDHDLLITSPSRLGDVLGTSKWGTELGPVKALRFAFPAFMDGFVAILPGLQRSFDVMIWTSPETYIQLKSDRVWTKSLKLVK